MSTTSDRGYKRSWKNLLINKRYQLRFTLFMVGLSTLLMAGLGVWVMRVADETTKIARTSVMGTRCPEVPELEVQKDPEPAPPRAVPMNLDTPVPEAAGSADGEGSAAPPRRKIVVNLDPMEMAPPLPKQPPSLPPDFALTVVKHWTCELKIEAALEALDHGRMRILWVLIGTGLLLVFGLAAYGIKMTHKVAGPLFKVGLYLAKMRDGRYDKVYNLRKGDQLVEFYEHFKHAHTGVVALQQADIDRLKAVIAAAEAAGAGGEPVIGELRELLARKEKSVE